MSLSKRQQREQDTRKKRLDSKAYYMRKRQAANRTFAIQKQITKLLHPGITIRNKPKEVKYEDPKS